MSDNQPISLFKLKPTNLFNGALEPRGVLPPGHDHLSATVIHVEVVHEQAQRLHVSQTRQPTHASSYRNTVFLTNKLLIFCRAMLCRSAAYATARLSVRISVASAYCVETAKDRAIAAMECE